MARDLEKQRAWARGPKRRAYLKKWRAENRDKMLASSRKSYYKHRELQVRRVVEGVRKRRVKLAGRPRSPTCEICGDPAETVFDHCHDTGLFRGWLCTHCNRHLGWVERHLDLVEKMKVYLSDNDSTRRTRT